MAGNVPYIGSKISLITTSDIRYEGILYTLNREESTIAVQNVRSFGTEGRRLPEVPMSNEIYDFIIFRGKDLKDLTVLQGAPERHATPFAPLAGDAPYAADRSDGLALPYPPPPQEPVLPARSRGDEFRDTGNATASSEFIDPKGIRGRGKGGLQRKTLFEVLRVHKRAEEAILKAMRIQNGAGFGTADLRNLSIASPAVYHCYLDFVNYCCAPHTLQSDEQQWDSLCKALKKHFDKELTFLAANTPKAPPVPVQRPNNTLGDFMIENTKAGKKTNKATRNANGAQRGNAGRGAGRPAEKAATGEFDASEDNGSSQIHGGSWACPRCTLRNEHFLTECAACTTSKQQAAMWADFPPLG
jgi:hypothetical protein